MEGRRPPQLGSRGQGWVLLQGVIFGAFAAAAAWGPPWPAHVHQALLVVGMLVASLGAALTIASFVNLGKSLTPMPKPLEGARMKTTGAYALARHPIYGGLVLALAGGALTSSPVALIPVACLALLFEGKRRVEEAWLIAHYSEYPEYMRRVRRVFLPYVW
jgi:protein-S-isoprenylcysteine O-methyltransferase Ste14